MDNRSIVFAVCMYTAIFLLPVDIHAAAWTQGKGVGQAIFSLNAYRSGYYFDKHRYSHDSGNQFTKFEINPFVEYGLTDDITIGTNPLLQYWSSKHPSTSTFYNDAHSCHSGSHLNGGIIESEFLVRKRLLQHNNLVLSVQPLIKTPCVRIEDTNSSIIWNSYDVELRLLGGYGFQWESDGRMRPFTGQYHFINLESAYRKRHGPYSDQIKIDGTVGFRYNKDILILGQIFSVISTEEEYVGNTEVSSNVFAPHFDRYYNVKLQLSGVMQVTDTASWQLGIYTDILGKNYGQGAGVLTSLWQGF